MQPNMLHAAGLCKLHLQAPAPSQQGHSNADANSAAEAPVVDFHLIYTKYRVQIKRVRAYPCKMLQRSHGGGGRWIPSPEGKD